MPPQAPFTWESLFWEPYLPNFDLTDMEETISQGLSGFETFFTSLEKGMVLTPWSTAEDCMRLYRDFYEICQHGTAGYLELLGWIPKKEYETLTARCGELENQAEAFKTMAADKDREIKAQKRTITRLNDTLADQKAKLAEQKKELTLQQKAIAKLEANAAKLEANAAKPPKP
jgi:uncharacterized coiled-coil protein SlyX